MQGTNSIGNVQNGQIQNTASKAKSKAGKTSGIQQLFGDILGKANSGMINNGSAKEQFSDTKADNTYSDIRFKDNSVPAARKSDINDKISDVVSQVDAKADNIKDIIKIKNDSKTRQDILAAVDVFRSKIVDYSPDALCLEITGESSKINAFVELVKPFGIMEICRTGIVALERGSHCLNSDTAHK